MPTTSNFGWTTPADTDLVKDGAAAIRTLGNGIDSSLIDLKGGTTGQILAKASNTDLDYSWINNDQGDITAVNAGTGITITNPSGPTPSVALTIPVVESSGGTNQTTYTTGDLLYASGTNTLAKRAVGSNGQVLTVSGGVPTWAAAAGSDLVRITTNTFSGQSSLVFTDCFSSTYDNYLLIANVICSTGTPDVATFLRASGTNYTTTDQARTVIYTAWNSTVTGYGALNESRMANYNTNTAQLNFYHQIFNPFLSVRTQMIGGWVDSTDAGFEAYYAGNTNSYTSLNITVSSGTFSGEISIYGYKRS